jgi:hypothetical protein
MAHSAEEVLIVLNFWYGAPSLARRRVCLLQCTIYNIFYCLIFETPPTWRTRFPQEQGGLVIPPGTGFLTHWITSQSQSHVTTDGQSASLSWNKAPIWDLRPDFFYCQTVAGLLMWGALSGREDGSVVYNCSWPLPVQTFSGPTPMGLVNIIYCLRFETSLFVASYDSQGYGGRIRPRLHTGYHWITTTTCPPFIILGRTE